MHRNEEKRSHILNEATDRFVGKRGVVGVGWRDVGTDQLVVFLERHDPDQEHAIQVWAKRTHVNVEFLISGRFIAGSAA